MKINSSRDHNKQQIIAELPVRKTNSQNHIQNTQSQKQYVEQQYQEDNLNYEGSYQQQDFNEEIIQNQEQIQTIEVSLGTRLQQVEEYQSIEQNQEKFIQITDESQSQNLESQEDSVQKKSAENIDIPLQIQPGLTKKNSARKQDQEEINLPQAIVRKDDFEKKTSNDYLLNQKSQLRNLQEELEELKRKYQDLKMIESINIQTIDELRQFKLQQQNSKQKKQKRIILKTSEEDESQIKQKRLVKMQQLRPLQAQVRIQNQSPDLQEQEKLYQIEFKIGKEAFSDIRDLFEFYSSINHPLKYDKMELSSFRRFCLERLEIQKQEQGKIDIEFFKGNKSKSSKFQSLSNSIKIFRASNPNFQKVIFMGTR